MLPSFWKQIYSDIKLISGSLRIEVKGEERGIIKGQKETFWGDGSVHYPDWSYSFRNVDITYQSYEIVQFKYMQFMECQKYLKVIFLKRKKSTNLLITLPFLNNPLKFASSSYKVKSKFLTMVYKEFLFTFAISFLITLPCTFLFQAFYAAHLIFVYYFLHVLFSARNHLLEDILCSFKTQV